MRQMQPGRPATTTVRGSQLWIAPLVLGGFVLAIATPVALAARHPEALLLAAPFALGCGLLALLVAAFSREVVVGPDGLTVRGLGDRAAPPLPWDQIADIAYRSFLRRGLLGYDIRVTRADGRALVIEDYQVGSIKQVARAIASAQPGGPGGTPAFARVPVTAHTPWDLFTAATTSREATRQPTAE
jgi:hypothetical protein